MGSKEYTVVIAVHDCHSEMMGVYLVQTRGDTPEDAAYGAMHTTGVYAEFLNGWERVLLSKNIESPCRAAIEELKEHAMIEVFENPSFSNPRPPGLLQ